MARKSRKNTDTTTQQQTLHIYKVAIYARLSAKDNATNNIDTIQHQIDVIEEYISNQNDMVVFKKYIDNGKAGTNFNRPAFEEMMEDMLAKKFDCIIVRDLSRLGRDYIATGHYIESTFPYYNIRFISIKEGKDSANPDDDNTEFVLNLTNIINTLYAKDISTKVWNTLDTKLKNGETLGTIPYGYLRDENTINKLKINYEVSDNIVKIYEMRLAGKSYTDIARELNKLNILSPFLYKANDYNADTSKYKLRLWNIGYVSDILNNIVYTGDKVERKNIKFYAKNIPKTNLDKSEYKIIENSHPAIIDKEVFLKVQEINNICSKTKNKRKKEKVEKSIFNGLVRCKECGLILTKSKIAKGVKFYCRLTNANRGLDICCKEKSVFENELYELIVNEIRVHIALSNNFIQKLEHLKNDTKYLKSQTNFNTQINKIDSQLKSISNQKVNLYTSFFEKQITQETYILKKNESESLYEKLVSDKEVILEEQKKENFFLEQQNQWIDNILKNQSIDVLTAELLNELIETIYITKCNEVEIVWKFQENLKQLTKYLGGVAI